MSWISERHFIEWETMNIGLFAVPYKEQNHNETKRRNEVKESLLKSWS